MKRIIKVAIAGQGRSGYNIHANCLKNLVELYKITAVADQIEARRNDGLEILGAKAYSDYRDMLKAGGFDLFINALPSPLHVPATIEALEGGFHVVCEKPMAPTVNDFDCMLDTSKKCKRLLAPFQNNRLQPFFDKIQEVIASGVIGKVINIRSEWGGFGRRWDWQTLRENMGGSLFNTGPHSIDQALVLFGEERTPEVFCRMDCNHSLGGDAEDFCTLTLYDRERIAPCIEIHISAYNCFPQEHMYIIRGTYGNIAANASEVIWKYYKPEEAPEQKFWDNWSVDRKYPREELKWYEEKWSLEEEQLKDAVGYTLKSLPSGPVRFYHNIYDVLQDKAELLITPAQVRRQIAVLEECHRQNPLP